MSKVVPFKTHIDNVLMFLDEIKEEVANNKIENILIGCKCEDGEIMIGPTKNLDYGTTQEIISHLQTDLTFRIMKGEWCCMTPYKYFVGVD